MQVDFLAIGVDNYFDASGRIVAERSLQYAASDADKIFRTFAYLFDARHAALLTDGPQSKINPTRNAILRKLYELGRIDADDLTTLIVYFAGHGIGINGVLHFCPSDFDSEIREFSSLSIGLLCDLISQRRGKKCLILDCCRASLNRPSDISVPKLSRVSVPIGDELTILIACSDGQSSYETSDVGPSGGGIFTHEILSALSVQAQSSGTGYFSIGDVFREARDNTVQYIFEKTGFANQKPVAVGGDIDEFLLESKLVVRRENTADR
jgi:uncharacterized caspase-like protein